MLRALLEEDSLVLFELFASEEREGFMDIPLTSYPAFHKWINEVMASDWLGFSLCRVIEDHKGKAAGLILLSNIDYANQMAEMGTWIGRPYRGNGWNEQAKEEMLHIAFSQLGLSTILLITSQKNRRSLGSLAKLPYVTVPEGSKYDSLRKEREFFVQQPLAVFEIQKEPFMQYCQKNQGKP